MADQQSTLYRAVLFLGAPGTGKGTQTQAIGCLPGFYTFSTGAVLRSLDPSSDLGRRVNDALTRGDLVSNDIVLEVWQSHMQQKIEQGTFSLVRDTLLLDAYPRDVEQAKAIVSFVDFQTVIHLDADDEGEMKRRLRRRNARPDDRDDSVIDHRFEVYRRRTEPLIDFFSGDRVVTVDAAQAPLDILQKIAEKLSANRIL
jgi:adenylate kinase